MDTGREYNIMKESHTPGYLLFFIFIIVLSHPFSPMLHAGDYIVDSNSNNVDANPGDGICRDASGYCTLNAALTEANLDGEPSLITFSMRFSGSSYIPGGSLPTLVEEDTTIDASSQWNGSWPNGTPGIEIRGGSVNTGLIRIQTSGCAIFGVLFSGGGTTVGVYSDSLASGNTIGGPAPGQRCVFVTESYGVYLDYSTGTQVLGSYFGTTDGETLASVSGKDGVFCRGNGNVIQNNLFGGYSQHAIMVWGDDNEVIGNIVGSNVEQSLPLPNNMGIEASGNRTFISGNLFAASASHGIFIHNGEDIRIVGNFVGGQTSLGNGGDGIRLHGADRAHVGEPEANSYNRISYNSGSGIYLIFSSETTIQNNSITTNAADGIFVSENIHRIGGTSSMERNVIGRNGQAGIRLNDAHECVIQGNYIGFDSAGVYDAGNLGHGILVEGASTFNTIGGSEYAGRNYIGWNLMDGIQLTGVGTDSNTVSGNRIGIPVNRAFEAPNGNHGISLYNGASSNRIGEFNHPYNIVVSSGWSGIAIVNSDNNSVYLNLIGTTDGGLNWGNTYYGIHVNDGNTNQITQNVIAYNGTAGNYAGVRIEGSIAFRNRISLNTIHHNSGPGIELADGANMGVTAPIITSVTSTQINGTGPANSIVEFFSDFDDEGQAVEGFANSDAMGNFSINCDAGGPFVTATATDSGGNTSVFSSPFSEVTLGTRLTMPAKNFVPGGICALDAFLASDQARTNVPFCVVLDVAGQYFFWPAWTGAFDYQRIDVNAGYQIRTIIPPFTWPDTGSQSVYGLHFYAAMLTDGLDQILGGDAGYDAYTFGFEPQ